MYFCLFRHLYAGEGIFLELYMIRKIERFPGRRVLLPQAWRSVQEHAENHWVHIRRYTLSGTASLARGDMSVNQVYSPFQPSLTVPREPFRCLAMMISAMFLSGVSGS